MPNFQARGHSVQFMSTPQSQRTPRRPQHRFNIVSRPFGITPFFLAPVLPGETMKSLLLQARVVTDPVENRLIGWWKEYYFFYIKHRDLIQSGISEDLQAMMLNWNDEPTALNQANNPNHYNHPGGPDFVYYMLQRVVEEYFRDEGDAWDAYIVAGAAGLTAVPAAKLNVQSWLDNLKPDSEIDPPDDPELTVGADDKIKGSEIEALRNEWEFRRMNNLTQMDYEDFLATYGVRLPTVEEHVPELVRYIRDWQYPISAIDPADASAANSVIWNIRDSANKDRFFREPGFLFGVTVCRPKLYLSNQRAAAAGLLRNARAWLPALLNGDIGHVMSSFQSVPTAANSPLTQATSTFWVDLRDLYLYGDQYMNWDFAFLDSGNAAVSPSSKGAYAALPSVDSTNKLYPSATDALRPFVDTVNGRIREDGVVALNILGTQVDRT